MSSLVFISKKFPICFFFRLVAYIQVFFFYFLNIGKFPKFAFDLHF